MSLPLRLPATGKSANDRSGAIRLGALIGVFAVLAFAYSIVNPIFESPDESEHFFTALHLAQGRGFARPGPDTPWLQEAAQPPLYYLLAAGVMAGIDTSDAESLLWRNEHAAIGKPAVFRNKALFIHIGQGWPYRNTELAVHLARWVSILMAAATLALYYAMGRLLLPQRPGLALAATAFTALTPQFLFVSASVSNDNMTNLTVALTAWLLLRGLRVSKPRGWALALGLALGLAGLSKTSGLLLWPVVGSALLVVGWRRKALRRALGELVIIFAVAALTAGWWYIRNWLLYGDPAGVSLIVDLMGGRLAPPTLNDWIGELRGLRFSYLGLFGWFNVFSPIWMYRVAACLGVAALIGLPPALAPGLFGGRGRIAEREDLPWLLAPAAWLALVFAGLAQYNLRLYALQGRLLMPAAWAVSLFLVMGWAGLARAAGEGLRAARGCPLSPRARGLLVAAPILFMAAWALVAPVAIIAPAYAVTPRITPDQVPEAARRAPILHGEAARFLGGQLHQDTVRPGDVFQTTIYWESVAPFAQDYTVFIHANTPESRPVAESVSWPDGGGYPTSAWQPGEVIVDTHQTAVPLEAEAVAPTLLEVDTGLYTYRTTSVLPQLTADGAWGRSLIGALRLLPSQPPVFMPGVSVGAKFGESIELVGYALKPSAEARAGDALTVTLYWNTSARLGSDWTVFIHLRPKSGGAQMGADGAPRRGAWPTSAWEPGDMVEDSHQLQLPVDAATGPAELWVGLYGEDGARLPISAPGRRIEDNAMYLENVTVTRP